MPGGDAVEAVAAELGLALGHHRSQLTHQAPGAVGLTRGAHRPHVGQAAELVEQAAAEVDGVDLHVLWPVGEGEAGDQGAEQGALAASRSPDRGQVPGRTGEVQQQRLLCLRERLVEHADWNLQPAHPTRLRRAPATSMSLPGPVGVPAAAKSAETRTAPAARPAPLPRTAAAAGAAWWAAEPNGSKGTIAGGPGSRWRGRALTRAALKRW